jgi:GxxExxY protein
MEQDVTTKTLRALRDTKLISQKYVNDLAYSIVGCSIEVHKHLGPGLLESVYKMCLIDELKSRNLHVASEIYVPVIYKEKDLGGVLKLDLLIDDLIIVELKAVETLHPVYKAQLLTYLKLTGKPKGLLINFNVENITEHLVPLVTEDFARLHKF